MEKRNKDERNEDDGINRRAVLKRTGTAGVGLLGGSALVGPAAARGPPEERGPLEPNGPPGQSCNCDESAGDFIAKYDFECIEEENGECLEWGFVLTEGDDVVNIEVVDVKDDDESEPITVEFEAEGFVIQSVCAFGGLDTDTVEDEDGIEQFETDLENPGGQQAAISNLTFCGIEEEEVCPDLTAEYTCTVRDPPEDGGTPIGTRHTVTNNGTEDTDYGWAIIDSPNAFRSIANGSFVAAASTGTFVADASLPQEGVVFWEADCSEELVDELGLTTYQELVDNGDVSAALDSFVDGRIPDGAFAVLIDGYPVTEQNRVFCDELNG